MTGVAGLMLNAGAGVASAQVIYREAPPPVYREVPTRRYYVSDDRYAAQHIVRQAYRDVLRREPDRSGLRQYVNAMLYEGWSESDVRRSLANSQEYRQRFGRVNYWRYR